MSITCSSGSSSRSRQFPVERRKPSDLAARAAVAASTSASTARSTSKGRSKTRLAVAKPIACVLPMNPDPISPMPRRFLLAMSRTPSNPADMLECSNPVPHPQRLNQRRDHRQQRIHSHASTLEIWAAAAIDERLVRLRQRCNKICATLDCAFFCLCYSLIRTVTRTSVDRSRATAKTMAPPRMVPGGLSANAQPVLACGCNDLELCLAQADIDISGCARASFQRHVLPYDRRSRAGHALAFWRLIDVNAARHRTDRSEAAAPGDDRRRTGRLYRRNPSFCGPARWSIRPRRGCL